MRDSPVEADVTAMAASRWDGVLAKSRACDGLRSISHEEMHDPSTPRPVHRWEGFYVGLTSGGGHSALRQRTEPRFALLCRRLSPPCRRHCPSDWSQPAARRCRPMLVQAVRWATRLLRRKLERHPEHAGEPCLEHFESCAGISVTALPSHAAKRNGRVTAPLAVVHCNCHQTYGPAQTSRLGSPIRYLASLAV
jgi:hypothetical protein